MRFMVVEHFTPEDAVRIYARVRERGRMLPEGLTYLDSWVAASMDRCFQLMECEDRRLLDEWMDAWSDLVRFEVHPVRTSDEAAARAAELEGS